MTTELSPHRTAALPAVRGLAAAAHGGPALAVTVLALLLVLAQDLGPARGLLVVAAVLAGQLSIGWSNDLVDLARDCLAGRDDKPLATGAVPVGVVRACCVVAVLACVPLSLACGLAAGLVHLVCVASGWAYNLGLKSTLLSWLPYAVAFGGLTAFVALAGGEAPPWWWPAGGALLGVGAHLLNVLPDLADDAATGVRGLPHALGPRWIAPVAAVVLVAATVVALVGAAPPRPVVWATGGAVLVLAAGVVGLSGRRPFAAAVAIALVDAALLVVAR
ncbi:UbiA family prenyltransferase [Nocardioides sp. J2M5]|uniref:UbiA family prenyltransferase n=1 Tax=Nocardioides palaemonis TaxID=2829810 RepID=UPI001BA96F8B|nr:UbiA family prenyltransferase [Nocardioides palaemonis]MBS2938395.1 UbiA family prenyltransferase [Nocardioides palaemonis]